MTDPGEVLSKISGKRILDVAAGSGGNIYHLINSLKSYEEIIGVDLENPESIKTPDQENIINKNNISYLQMDAHDLVFDDESFDIVSIGKSLHHLDFPVKVLSQMFRVLKKDGYALLSEGIGLRCAPVLLAVCEK
ncbi:class I SAM-dependent methyltransferase [candidate division WOR-3 bacterium]|nr:class I SAM-dependent methyltransferase [candidate division WOR-3 bacterium]